MEIEHQVIAGGSLRGAAVEVNYNLVVAVHEVHLEALHAHGGVFAAGTLHILVEGPVACPEYETHSPFLRVFAEHREVDFRHHLEEVGLLVHGPSLVQNNVLDAVAGGEIYVVLIRVVVDA